MKKSKSDVLLEALDKNELTSFDRFISYSLNGKSGDVMKYWKYKLSIISSDSKEPHTKFIPRKILSDFTKQIEKYFILKNLEKDKFYLKLFLSRELRKRNIDKYFEQLLDDIKSVKSKKSSKNGINTLSLLKLNSEEYLLSNSRNDEKNMYGISKERTKLSEILIAHSKLFEFFNKKLYSSDYDNSDSGLICVDTVVTYIENNSVYIKKEFPDLWILYLLIKIIYDFKNEERIKAVIKYIGRHEDVLSDEFLQFVYESLFRLLISKINAGSHSVHNDFYKILSGAEKRGVLKRLPDFQPRNLLAFIHVSLDSGDISLAERLLSKYSCKIMSPLKDQVLNICSSMIEFSKGNFENVKNMLIHEKPHDAVFYVFCKTTLVKSYYELNEFRRIYPLTDSIRHFLQRRHEIHELEPSVIKFIKCVNKLAFAKKNDRKRIEDIIPVISDEKYFFMKHWVALKIEQMKTIPEEKRR